ncbi:MAG: CotH kinase family protein [Bacteroidales bacterium]|nr:CotH kinase family protein [Bacteroidales bacterium]
MRKLMMFALLSMLACASAFAANVTVYFENIGNWSEVWCYAWKGSHEPFGKWGGKRLTATTVKDGKTLYYVDDVPEGYEIIFNNGNNGAQTADLPAKDGYIYNPDTKADDVNGQNSELKPTGTLPVIYIETDEIMLSKDLADKDYRAGTYWIDANGIDGFTSVGSADAPLPLQIKARGNYTRTAFSKKPFKLKLGSKAALLGLSKSKHFALLAHADDDKGYLKNFVGFNLGQRIGLTRDGVGAWTPTEQPVEVMLNGKYWGLYFLTESIRMGEDRIPAGELDDNVTDGTKCSGPYLIELDNYKEGDGQIVMNEWGTDRELIITPDTPELYSDIQRKFISDQFGKMNEFIGKNNDELWGYMDLDAAARYYIVMEIIDHWESYHGSTYMFRDFGEGKKWIFSPLWDCGNAFTRENPDSYFTNVATYGNNWIDRMRQNDKFMTKVKETYRWFYGTQVNDLMADIDRYVRSISAAAVRDHERWGNAPWPDKYVDNHGHDTAPTYVRDNSDMNSAANFVKNALNNKINWLNGQWGHPDPNAAEPARDTTPAAKLPDYVDPDPELVTVYYKADGVDDARIWIWDSNQNQYFGVEWNDRPHAQKATDKSGETYFYYTVNAKGLDMNSAMLIFSDNDGKHSTGDQKFVPGAIYIYKEDGNIEIIEGYDPDPVTVSGTMPVFYVNTTETGFEAWLDPVTSSIAPIGSKESPVALKSFKGLDNADKCAYKIQFNAKQVMISGIKQSKHYNLMPWCEDSELAYLCNITGHELGAILFESTEWTPAYAPVELVLDGDYRGLYFVVENIRPAGARVNIKDISDMTQAPESWTDWIVRIDDAGSDVTVDGVSFVAHEPAFDNSFVTDAHRAYLTEQMQAVVDAFTDPAVAWDATLDANSIVNYYLLQEIVDDTRSFATNCYFYQGGGDNKWHFGPVWDFAGAFASRDNKSQLIYEQNAALPLIGSLFTNSVTFRYLVANRLKALTSSAQSVMMRAVAADSPLYREISDRIDRAYDAYKGALALDGERWPSLAVGDADRAVADVKSYLGKNIDFLTERFSDYTTGISSVEADADDAVVEIYDVYGRRVADPSAGLYIERRGSQARKVIVR